MSTTTNKTADMTADEKVSTARIPLRRDGLLAKAVAWYSRRAYGAEMEPMLALLNHRRVTLSIARFEMSLAKWRELDQNLKELACLSVASEIGCTWCIDFGYYLSRTNGMPREKLEQVGGWRTSTIYTPLERKVLEYAEAMTATPPTVTDEMVAGLREDLSDAQVVELTSMISVENIRSRTNAALGLSSQGFRDRCDLPEPGAS